MIKQMTTIENQKVLNVVQNNSLVDKIPLTQISHLTNQPVQQGYVLFDNTEIEPTTNDLEVIENGIKVKTAGSYCVKFFVNVLSLTGRSEFSVFIDKFIKNNQGTYVPQRITGNLITLNSAPFVCTVYTLDDVLADEYFKIFINVNNSTVINRVRCIVYKV